MSSLAQLVADLPARVHVGVASRRDMREVVVQNDYTDELHEQWLRDLDAEAGERGRILPFQRPQRPLDPRALEEGALADLIIEKNRRSHGGETVVGPAPASKEGLRATLRSFIDAREPCDRYDALIRHAATALRLAEEISAGRA